jgi:hypothetical protein
LARLRGQPLDHVALASSPRNQYKVALRRIEHNLLAAESLHHNSTTPVDSKPTITAKI